MTSEFLQSALEQSLRRRLSAFVSQEYDLKWKTWDIASGPPICALRASGRRTSGSGCTGSRTPSAGDSKRGVHPNPDKQAGSHSLNNEAALAGHPTPSSEGSAGEISEDLERVGSKFRNRKTGRVLQTNLATDTLMLCGHPTPNTPSGGPNSQRENRNAGGADLEEVANLAGTSMLLEMNQAPRQLGASSAENDTPTLHGDGATGNVPIVADHPSPCPKCGAPMETDHNSAQCHACQMLWPLAGHPTPRNEDAEQTGAHRGQPDTLTSCERLAGHPTCAATDGSKAPKQYAGGNPSLPGSAKMAASPGPTTASTATSTAKTAGYRLNPGFSLWLMIGIPSIVDAWASCGVRGMLSARRSPRSS